MKKRLNASVDEEVYWRLKKALILAKISFKEWLLLHIEMEVGRKKK